MWKPELNDVFWYVGGDGRVFSMYNDNYNYAERLIKSLNCYKTEEQANQAAANIKLIHETLHMINDSNNCNDKKEAHAIDINIDEVNELTRNNKIQIIPISKAIIVEDLNASSEDKYFIYSGK